MSYFLGIDAGTTSLKAAIFNQNGKLLSLARREYSLETPAPTLVELDAAIYWTSCCSVVRQAIQESQIPPAEVDSICISSQGETIIPVGRDGKPSHKAIVWLDNRAGRQAEEISDHFGIGNIYHITGQPEVAPTWPACKILWLRQKDPLVFAQTARFLLVEDYLLYRLTGQYVTERGLQTTSLFVDLNTRQWWPEMFDYIGITPNHFGRLMDPGMAVGPLSEAGAEAIGLTSRTLAVTGSMDQSIGAIGSGNIAAGMVTESTGGALGIVSTVKLPVFDPQARLPCYFHARKDFYALLPWGQTAGMALRWFRDQFFPLESRAAEDAGLDAYDLMTYAAASVPAGSDGMVVLPHLEGAACPEFNRNARAVFYGATLRHTRAHFTRAILESVAYMLRKNLEIVERVGGPMCEIRSTGGGARSRLWLQIKADVLQKPVTTVDVEEAACLGAAMSAAVAAGCYASLEEASRAMVRVRDRLEPNPANASAYQDGYATYLELFNRLEPMFHLE
jgi:xylulokinase